MHVLAQVSDEQVGGYLIVMGIFLVGWFVIGVGLILSVFRTARYTRKTAEYCAEIAKACRRTASGVARLGEPDDIPPER